jgi:hypothetical protein
MADLEDIVQRVAIEGTGEAGSALGELAEVAESAFAKISEVAESGATGLTLFSGGALALVAAFATAAYAISTFEEHTAKANAGMAALGQSFGTTAAGVQGLRAAFAESGVDSEILNRAMTRTSVLIANSYAQIQRATREDATQQESAAEQVVAAHIRVDSAYDKDTTASEEWSQKLRTDSISVAEAWNKLSFAAQDMSSQTSSDMLGIESATLGVAQAQQKLRDFQSGTTDKAAAKDLQGQQLEMAVRQAQQRENDARLKQQKDDAQAPLTQARATLGVDEAQLKQTQDVNQSFTALASSANDVVKALTGLKEASQRQYDAQLKSLPALEASLKGAGGGINVSEAQTHDITKAIQDMANQASATGRATALQTWTQAQQVFKGGQLDSTQMQSVMQQFGFSTRGGGTAGAEAVQAFMKSKDFSEIARTSEADPNKLNAADITKSQEVVQSGAQLSAKFSELTEKAASASGSLADFSINIKRALDNLLTGMTPPVPGHADGGPVRGPGTGTSDGVLARLSSGEYVHQTAAVKFWGNDFMDAINNMQLPGFAFGGPVISGVKSAGAGAGKGPGSTLNLQIGDEHFDGLHAPQGVAEKLTHYAIARQTSATGRNPSWMG